MKHFPVYWTVAFIAATGLVLGTLTCGWVCPIGFIQDVFHAPFPREQKSLNKLKPGRYAVLLMLILLVFLEAQFLIFSRRGIDVFHEWVIYGGTLFLFAAFFVKRPFCRTLCPFGLVYGKLNRWSPVRVRLNQCQACGECDTKCIVDVKPLKEVNGDLCVKCFGCKIICNRQKKDEKSEKENIGH